MLFYLICNKRGKKIFSFESNKTTFLKAIEFIASKREEVRETLEENGMIRENQDIEETTSGIEEGETFLDKVDVFLETKEISAIKLTIPNYSTTLNIDSKPLHNKSIENITSEVYPPNSKIRVVSPLKLSDESVILAVISRLSWIKELQQNFLKQPRQSKREMVGGESHYLFGKRYLLDVIYRSSEHAIIKNHSKLELW